MFYLIATILCNVILFALFKLFPKYHVDSLHAIVANYFTCIITGCIFLGSVPYTSESVEQSWFWWAIAMGGMFISLFNLISYRTREDGITTATIANKLSLVIPVVFSLWLYNEVAGPWKITGIVLALPAVYLTTRAKEEDAKPKSIIWPLVLFIGSGLLDTLVKYVQHHHLDSDYAQKAYTIYVFTSAFILGLLYSVLVHKKRLTRDSVIAGIILGVPNYFSIYFLIQLLNSDFLQSSAAIPVNNIGIVLCSAITALIFFKEKLTPMRVVGLVLSIIAILLIALADMNGGKI
jgi:drug/metabolite transporter (DMT)-like permease